MIHLKLYIQFMLYPTPMHCVLCFIEFILHPLKVCLWFTNLLFPHHVVCMHNPKSKSVFEKKSTKQSWMWGIGHILKYHVRKDATHKRGKCHEEVIERRTWILCKF